MEPIRVIKASRAVSLRELSRKIAPLVDEVELEGSVFVLSRYGRMVAVLAPIPERTVLEFSGRAGPSRISSWQRVTSRYAKNGQN
jgi:antitoxin (DNA-binding transcriptional repressor) of toxin-antitoxin stability system